MANPEDKPAKTGESHVERAEERTVFAPYVDIYEDESGLTLVADMPGVPADGVDARVEKDTLTIRGRVPQLQLEESRQIYAEYKTGDYERSFTISQAVDTQKIEASMANGVLTLRLPKSQQAKERRIQIKAG